MEVQKDPLVLQLSWLAQYFEALGAWVMAQEIRDQIKRHVSEVYPGSKVAA